MLSVFKTLRSRFSESLRALSRTRTITTVGLLLAIQMVLSSYGVIEVTDSLKISLAHLALTPTAILFGPVAATLQGALSDILGFIIKPTGPYFPGFTLTNVLVGLVCGFILHGQKPSWWRCIAAVTISLAGLNLFLNSLWLHMLAYVPDRGYFAWVTVRAPNYLVEVPVNTVLCYLLLQAMKRVKLPASMQMKD